MPESQADSNSTEDLGEELGQIWGTVTEGCSECDSNIDLSETQGNQVLPVGPGAPPNEAVKLCGVLSGSGILHLCFIRL